MTWNTNINAERGRWCSVRDEEPPTVNIACGFHAGDPENRVRERLQEVSPASAVFP